MRVRFVTPALPWPPDQGARIRASGLIRALPREVEVELWWVARPGEPGPPAELRTRCRVLRRFERSRPGFVARWALPRAARWFWSRDLADALARGAEEVDLVHLDEPSLVPLWPECARGAAILQHHKLESVLADELAARAPDRAAARKLHVDAARWRRLEAEAVERIPHQIVCCAEDAARLRERHPTLVPAVVESGVDLDRFAPSGAPRERDLVLFLGTLDYGPNSDGLRTFLADAWPALHAARPGLRLAVVGRGSAPEIESACSFDSSVEWIGGVDDVRPWLARAGALVVPLRVGGGTRVKIVEALASGTPVVSTPVGAEGLALEPGVHARIAELGPAFVDATLDALDAPQDDSMIVAGRARVAERYTWSVLAGRLAVAWRDAARA